MERAVGSDVRGPSAGLGLQIGAIGVGTCLGDYVIEELLGHGGQGQVYLARDVVLGRRAALKMLRTAAGDATRGMVEARLMATLEHPNIVRVYHALRHQELWLVALEYVAGGSLQAHVERAGPLPAARAVELAAGAAAGLGHAHQLGILHRDVKPHNLLLGQLGELKLGDFGLAIQLRGSAAGRGFAAGTPAFLAPELWGDGAPSPASDIYSLGACLFFLLTGRVPFPFVQLEQLEQAHRKLQPRLPVELPAGVREVLLAMLAKDPAQRPGSASQLALELSALVRAPPAPALPARGTRASAPRSPILVGGAERALAVVFSRGPEGAYLTRLLELLQQPTCALALQSSCLSEARSLLRLALERSPLQRRRAARLCLSTPAASVHEQLVQKLALPPGASPACLCQRLAEPGGASRGPCVLEVRADFVPSERQHAELAALASAAAAHELTIALLVTTAQPAPGMATKLPGFELLCLPGAALPASDFAERARLWLAVATDERWQVSADALRLLQHACLTHGHFWPQLLQDSLLISAAARLPVVTSWAVQAAQRRGVPLQAVADVPVECRSAPRRWPSPQLATLLTALRQGERLADRPALDPS